MRYVGRRKKRKSIGCITSSGNPITAKCTRDSSISLLLRVLEDGFFTPVGGTQPKQADVRVVAATNVALQAKIAEGTFRADLYYRLARFPVEVPPLRERKEDIPLLANHFLEMFAAEMKVEQPTLTPEALMALEAYHFPGNVRELKNIIEHALIKSRGEAIQLVHLHFIESPPTSAMTDTNLGQTFDLTYLLTNH